MTEFNSLSSLSNVHRQLRTDALQAASAEQALQTNFKSWVQELDLEALIARTQTPPKKLGRYALVPIVGNEYADRGDSTIAAGEGVTLPGNVTLESTARQRLFLDTALAIGLTHDDVLRAVSGAYISAVGCAVVVHQNQGLIESKPQLGRENPALRSGLHGGFPWQDPLVQGWITIGGQLDVNSVRITSAHNSQWAPRLGKLICRRENRHIEPEVFEAYWTTLGKDRQGEYRTRAVAQLKPNYDDVATRLNFSRTTNGDWAMPLQPTTPA